MSEDSINTNSLHFQHSPFDPSFYYFDPQELYVSDVEEISTVSIVYFDASFWKLMRDVCVDRINNHEFVALYQSLCHLREQGKIICPVNIDALYGLLQQTSWGELIATMTVVDRLSGGVGFLPYMPRALLETDHYFQHTLTCVDTVYKTPSSIWISVVPWLKHQQAFIDGGGKRSDIRHRNESLSDKPFSLFNTPDAAARATGNNTLTRYFTDTLLKDRMTLLQQLLTPLDYCEFKHAKPNHVWKQEVAQSLNFIRPYVYQRLKCSSWLSFQGGEEQFKAAVTVLISSIYQKLSHGYELDAIPSVSYYALAHGAALCGNNQDLLFNLVQSSLAIPYSDLCFSCLSLERDLTVLPQPFVSDALIKNVKCQLYSHLSDMGKALDALQKLETVVQR